MSSISSQHLRNQQSLHPQKYTWLVINSKGGRSHTEHSRPKGAHGDPASLPGVQPLAASRQSLADHNQPPGLFLEKYRLLHPVN